MSNMLPTYDKAQLKETAQYILNALNNTVIEILAQRAREPLTAPYKNPSVLSESILGDLDSTLCSSSSKLVSDNECSIIMTENNDNYQNDQDDENKGHDSSNSFTDKSTRALNDSITMLKQP